MACGPTATTLRKGTDKIEPSWSNLLQPAGWHEIKPIKLKRPMVGIAKFPHEVCKAHVCWQSTIKLVNSNINSEQKPLGRWSNLTVRIFVKWVGSTTNHHYKQPWTMMVFRKKITKDTAGSLVCHTVCRIGRWRHPPFRNWKSILHRLFQVASSPPQNLCVCFCGRLVNGNCD